MNPGDVVTAAMSGGVGAEKDKVRPMVVACDAGRTVLVVAITDAGKKRLPTHALLQGYSSGTQVKDALATCEHAWFLDPSRLTPRVDARPLTAAEVRSVGRCLRIALALSPGRAPPGTPRFPRGAIVGVDFSGGIGAELDAEYPALVLSNDVGNYFGRTLLVAPILDAARAADAVIPVAVASGVLDLGRLRIADFDRVTGVRGAATAADVANASAELARRVPPG